MKKFFVGLALATIAFTGAASAQEAPFAKQIKARQGIMVYRALNIGVLGAMAKGEVEYNAEAAQKAADALVSSGKLDVSMLYVPGSSNAENPDSTVKPEVFTEDLGIGAKAADFNTAAEAMQAAAGGGLDGLKAAMGPLGKSCGGCHEVARIPQN
ncbi:cytochrome c [Defluviimonas aestuarii]|uniref:c-type cytochrome n=1 Tax=Albidovulum aestuarii TaxID=1130726 RepID=UPI00249A1AFB|nr:cytochrome c [Defluviimonas aestuarii]MDI3337337.1 cytochrome c [Defluviimonas aestuarii]